MLTIAFGIVLGFLSIEIVLPILFAILCLCFEAILAIFKED